MATLDDITITPSSRQTYMDALLGEGPDWNFLTGANNVIRFTFDTSSGKEAGQSGQTSFSEAQQTSARVAMAMTSVLTGINFVEAAAGSAAQVHFANTNISGANVAGLCNWQPDYLIDPANRKLLSYSAQAYIYLDDVEFDSQNANLAPGTPGYETLLREIGHMLGLQRPSESWIVLPAGDNNTSNTLMSDKHVGGPYSSFSPYDICALDFLYGRDGLGGAFGVGSTGGYYFTGTNGNDFVLGTSKNDLFTGAGGNDFFTDAGGEDTAVFSGPLSSYSFSYTSGHRLVVKDFDTSATLDGVENLRFADRTVRADTVISLDVKVPVVPTLAVTTLANGYVAGNMPTLSGSAEARTVVNIYAGTALLVTTFADASGAYSTVAPRLGDGTYVLYATATDSAGNVSLPSARNTVKVDVTAPVLVTASVSSDGVLATNQPVISGTGEAGVAISVISQLNGVTSVVGDTVVSDLGTWKVTPLPLANGTYTMNVKSTDGAGHSSMTTGAVTFTVGSALNPSGTDANDSFNGAAGNNAFDGHGGVDTVRYANPRGSYAISKNASGFTVTAAGGNDGVDTLVNIERLQFANAATAFDVAGNGGQSYRIYKAAFDRAPDLAGLGFWIKALDDGQSLRDVAKGFIGSAEFTQLYGANASNTAFVTKLYEHVLHRSADGAGFDFWLNGLNSHATARADVLAQFSESNENQAQVIGQIQNGLDYIPWA